MNERLKGMVRAIREAFARTAASAGGMAGEAARSGSARAVSGFREARGALLVLGVMGGAGYWLYLHPPVKTVGRGETGIRANRMTGEVTQWGEGGVLALPGLHEFRVYPLRDQTYRPEQSMRADGPAPFQSVEGLSLGIDFAVRYAVDPAQLREKATSMPDDLEAGLVEPAVQGVIYKTFARYTVREIFSTKRAEIQAAIEQELKGRLAAEGLSLRGVQMGKVDLPADYKRGMESLLAEELATEKMRYTIELKSRQVKETELEAEAEKTRREKRAEAAAREQVIAARAQEEAMKHVLPFKERQVQQRQLEAEAEKQARIRNAEGSAQARRIEANGEADARQKLADAEAYRLERIGKVNAEQMEREGALVSRHPLLIQKALADKLSDKVQVIIAPPPADGGFVGANLVGGAVKTGSR